VSLYAAGYSATPPLLPANGSLIATVFYPDEG
jgi:hypothetical protein